MDDVRNISPADARLNVSALPVNPKGWWKPYRRLGKLVLKGKIAHAEPGEVQMFVGDVPIRASKIEIQGKAGLFSFKIDESFDRHIPKGWKVSIVYKEQRIPGRQGEDSADISGHSSPEEFQRKVEQGYYLTKKGKFILPLSASVERRRAILKAYGKLAKDFQEVTGYPLWITMGTLLGLIRDGGFLKNDDDFDTAYLSRATSVEEIIVEREEIALKLLRKGWKVSVSSPSGLIKYVRNGDVIDIMPGWMQNGHFFCLAFDMIDVREQDLLPVKPASLDGAEVFVPFDPLKFLEKKYGEGWRIPDASYVPKRPEAAVAILMKGKLNGDQAKAINARLKARLGEEAKGGAA